MDEASCRNCGAGCLGKLGDDQRHTRDIRVGVECSVRHEPDQTDRRKSGTMRSGEHVRRGRLDANMFPRPIMSISASNHIRRSRSFFPWKALFWKPTRWLSMDVRSDTRQNGTRGCRKVA